jgi:hypothetical protein
VVATIAPAPMATAALAAAALAAAAHPVSDGMGATKLQLATGRIEQRMWWQVNAGVYADCIGGGGSAAASV